MPHQKALHGKRSRASAVLSRHQKRGAGRFELLEPRLMLTGDWQNLFLPADLNFDGRATPQDALLAINELNGLSLIDALGNLPRRDLHTDAPFYDTNGDGSLTSLDVLRIINALNGDAEAPVISAALVEDSAPEGTNEDRLTRNPALQGTVRDVGTGPAFLRAEVNGGAIVDVALSPDGTFHFDPGLALDGSADGSHVVVFTAADGRDNHAEQLVFEFVLDRTGPVPPAGLGLAGGDDTGFDPTDGVTSNSQPAFTGRVAEQSRVRLLIDGLAAGQIDTSGSWEIVPNALEDGEYAVAIESIDLAGNVTQVGFPTSLVIDTTAPQTPTVRLDPASDSGVSNADGITGLNSPRFDGTALDGTQVEVLIGGALIGRVVSDGMWSFTAESLLDGNHDIQARAIDLAGNASALSDTVSVHIDTVAPVVPTLRLTASSDSGASSSDRITNVATPTLTGFADPDSLVLLRRDGVQSGQAMAENRVWELTSETLVDGTHTFDAVAMDLAGNTSGASTPSVVTIDTNAPAPPTIAVAADSDTGIRDDDAYTRDTTPTLQGTAEIAASVEVLVDGVSQGIVALDDSSDAWTLTTTTLNEGQRSAQARATDLAGNVGALSVALPIAIDTTPPGIITDLVLAASSDSGRSDTDGVTNQTTLTYVGSAEAQSTVELLVDGQLADSVLSDGSWQAVAMQLANGVRDITARVIDRAGNVGPLSIPIQTTVDTIPPQPPSLQLATASDSGADSSDGVTNVVTPTFMGGSEPDVEIVVSLDGDPSGDSTNSDGNWQWLAPALADGVYQITANATDPAGNVSVPSSLLAVTIDTEVSGPTTLSLASTSDTGASDSDRETSDTTPTLMVETEAGSNVEFFVGASNVGTDTATSGIAQVTVPTRLSDGAHTLSARITDIAGNTADAADVVINVDTMSPTIVSAPTGELTVSPRLINIQFDEPAPVTLSSTYGVSFDGGPNAGQAVPIADIRVSANDPRVVEVELNTLLPDGSYVLNVQTADRAGNAVTGPTSFSFSVADPPSITQLSPGPGEEMVSVTREAIVRFDEPIDPATITSSSFQVMALGQSIAGRRVVSSTERFVTFFYDEPLPASTEVRVLIDGDIIAGRDGGQLDADGDGRPGGQLGFNFRTLPLTRITGTNVFGFVRDSVTGEPIEGVTIRVDAFPQANAVTDASGRFELVDMPAPDFFVHVDGSTAVDPPAGFVYPNVGKPFHSVPGQTVQLEANGEPFDVFLPPMSVTDVQALSSTTETTVGFGDAGKAELARMFPNIDPAMFDRMTVTIAPGAAVDEQGDAATQAAIIPVAPDRIPAPLPPNLNPALVVSIQAPGATNFDVPAAVSFPNLEGLAPGEETLVMSFDHDAGRWVANGTATVSADGLSIESNGGVIAAPGWHIVDAAIDFVGEVIGAATDATRDFLERILRDLLTFGEIIRDLPAELAELYRDLASLTDPAVRDEFIDLLGQLWDDIRTGDDAAWAVIQQQGSFALQFWGTSISFYDFLKGTVLKGGDLLDAGRNIVTSTITLSAEFLGTGMISQDSIDNAYLSVAGAFAEVAEVPGSDAFANAVDFVGLAQNASGLRDARQRIRNAVVEWEATLGASANRAAANGELRGAATALESTARRLRQAEEASSAEFLDRLDRFDSILTEIDRLTFFGRELETNPSDEASAQSFIESLEQIQFQIDGLSALGVTDFHSLFTDEEASHGTFINDAFRPIAQLPFTEPQVAFYQVEFDDLAFHGETNQTGMFSLQLPRDRTVEVTLFSRERWTAGTFTIQTPNGGRALRESFLLGGVLDERDTDGDRLLDLMERAVGTSLQDPDTDDDGIDDLAEIEQGLNPLDNRGFPTGIIASLPLPGQAKEVVLEGSLRDDGQAAYLATGTHGLAIVDTTQFDNPIMLGQLDLAGDATDIDIEGTLAVLAANDGGVHMVDVSDPMLPVLVESFDLPAAHVEVVNGVAFLGIGSDLLAVDVATGERLSQLRLGDSDLTGMATEGTFLYTMDNDRNLRVLDIASSLLQTRGAVQLPHAGGRLTVGDGIAYAAAQSSFRGGLSTADVSNPGQPLLISGSDVVSPFVAVRQHIVPNGSGLGLALGNAGGGAADVVDLGDPAETDIADDLFLTRFRLPVVPFSGAIGAGIGFIADGTAGLQVVNYQAFDNQGQAPVLTFDAEQLDVDPTTSGIQVVEGTSFPLRLDELSDDVQVRNVELLMDGSVVRNDVSFPFDLLASIPPLSAGSNTVSIQVRATDTGGNSTSSPIATLDIVPDIVPPEIVRILPADDAARLEGRLSARVLFSEAMDAATVNAASIQLARSESPSIPISPLSIQLRANGQEAVLTFDSLAVDDYILALDTLMLADLAGNIVGGAIATSSFRVIENRDPGDTIASSLNVGTLVTPITFAESIGVNAPSHTSVTGPDRGDVYTFTVDQVAKFRTFVSGQTADIFIELYGDVDGDGTFESNERLHEAGDSACCGRVADFSSFEGLTPGTYQLRVVPANGITTDYMLTLSAELIEVTDPVDPGDTIATARDLGPLATPLVIVDGVGSFDAGDVYAFTVEEATRFTAMIAGHSNDIVIELFSDLDDQQDFDVNSERLFSVTDGRCCGGVEDFSAVKELTAGEYFLRVIPFGTASSSVYTLSVTTEVITLSDENDPGDTIDTARNLGPLSSAQTIIDIVGPRDDSDVYTFELQEPSRVTAAISGQRNDIFIELYTDLDDGEDFDANTERLYSVTDGNCCGNVADFFATKELPVGVYHLRVVRSGPSGSTAYTLDLSREVITLSDNNDPGDTINTARNLGPLTSEQIMVDIVGPRDESDVYTFELQEPSRVTAAISGQRNDIFIELYTDLDDGEDFDANTERLYSVTDGNCCGNVADFFATKDLPVGVYHLRVVRSGPSISTAYTLELSREVITLSDNDDPGDTIDTARNLGPLNSEQTRVDIVGPRDESDVYTFELQDPSRVTAAISGHSNDVFIELYADLDEGEDFDANTERLFSVGDGHCCAVVDFSAGKDLPVGVYHLRVVRSGVSASTAYTLTLTPEVITLSDDNDPGDTITTARNLGPLSSELTRMDIVGPRDESDVYTFELQNPSRVTAAISGHRNDIFIELYADLDDGEDFDANTERLFSVGDGHCCAVVDFSAGKDLPVGVYHLRVVRSGASASTAYTLNLTPEVIALSDNDDPGETIATARNLGPLNTPQTIVDIVGAWDPRDVFTFSINASQTVTAAISSHVNDLAVELWADTNNNQQFDSGERIARAADGHCCAVRDFSLVESLAPGTYHLVVVPESVSGSSAYEMTLSAAQPLLAGVEPGGPNEAPWLDSERLDAAVATAVSLWASSGADPRAFRDIDYRISNLSGNYLGLYAHNVVWIDADAAGQGWYASVDSDRDHADNGRVDLVTVVAHELGHALGLPDRHDEGASIMAGRLGPGRQRRPVAGDLPQFRRTAFSSFDAMPSIWPTVADSTLAGLIPSPFDTSPSTPRHSRDLHPSAVDALLGADEGNARRQTARDSQPREFDPEAARRHIITEWDDLFPLFDTGEGPTPQS